MTKFNTLDVLMVETGNLKILSDGLDLLPRRFAARNYQELGQECAMCLKKAKIARTRRLIREQAVSAIETGLRVSTC